MQVRLARRHPGRWVDGNRVFGASRREYQPSDDELIESEIGRRIREIASRPDAGPAVSGLRPARSEVAFHEIAFNHADVMGSGRFFYASAPTEARVPLRPK